VSFIPSDYLFCYFHLIAAHKTQGGITCPLVRRNVP
jgi:hypothetical protein